MKRTIRLPRTLCKTATTLAMLALTCGTALGNPSLANENGRKKNEISPAAHNHEDHDESSVAKECDRQVPDQVTSEHWAYKEIAELLQKYAAEKKLPEGRDCSRGELTDCLLAVLNRVVEKYEQEGAQAIHRDDLEDIAALHIALEGELSQQGAYQTIRKNVEEILVLVEPEVPAFQYKFGVNGILRSDVVGNFRLPDSSFIPGRKEGRLVYRVKPYAYWHPADWLDIYLEGQGYGFDGGDQRYNKFSLYQGFVEAKLPGNDRLALKGGRQEFNYGSSFILGADSFHSGLSFDAVRLRVKPLEDLTVDLLGGSYAVPWADGVKGNLRGVYATYAPSKKAVIEAYLFRDTGSDDHHSGEYRDTYGLRSTSTLGPLTLELEPVLQSGKLFNPDTGANEVINAYGGHIDLAGEAELGGFKNTIFLSYAVGSGDNDGRKEFGNPNNDNSLVGDMGVIGDLSGVDVGNFHASGIQAFTLGWGIDLADNVNLTATGRKFMANAVPDGFSRNLGVEADFTLTCNINKDFTATIGYDHFFTGKFFRDASGSGKDIDYGYAMLVFNLDKTKKRMAMK